MTPPVQLPENISIYTGPNGGLLLSGRLFTRLVTTASDAQTLSRALGSDAAFAAFSHQHGMSVLLFDEHDQDRHHEHFRQVCLCLKDHGDIGLAFGQCVFDANTVVEAGFQTDRLNGGAIMVVDLRHGDDDASSDEEGLNGELDSRNNGNSDDKEDAER